MIFILYTKQLFDWNKTKIQTSTYYYASFITRILIILFQRTLTKLLINNQNRIAVDYLSIFLLFRYVMNSFMLKN